MSDFILASASPRREEILLKAGFSFDIIPSGADEEIKEPLTPEETVCELARRKAFDVALKNKGRVVFGCDTVVAVDGKILGKPHNDAEAREMLNDLSGKAHIVCTGVCITDTEKTVVFCDTTEVIFYDLSRETIDSYIATKEGTDKAGSYGIQGFGSLLVREIRGDYFSVMGLPVAKAARALAAFGIKASVIL